MLLLYFRRLWDRPHYQIFPLALIALGIFAYLRWPRDEKRKYQNSFLATTLLLVGLLLGLLGYVFVEPWFGAASAACLAASLFSRTVESETNKTLLSLSLFAFFCVRPPFEADQRLMSWLQQVSAKFTSELLDLVGAEGQLTGEGLEHPLRHRGVVPGRALRNLGSGGPGGESAGDDTGGEGRGEVADEGVAAQRVH
jgi:cell division protein FtsW (lipid II flippase)